MQLETQRTNRLNLNMADLVSFSIFYHMCSPILMYIKLHSFVLLDYREKLEASFGVSLKIILSQYARISVLFPILRSEHFFLIVFQFADKTMNIIDNLTLPKNPSARYDDCDTLLKRFFSKYLIQRGRPKAKEIKNFRTVYVKTDYQDNINLHDCGIYAMCHMNTYYGSIVKDAKSKVCHLNFTTFKQHVKRQYTT
ncbi:hypothetical protein Cgig2_021397 [Carnegiea gigantea]|uniref:Ubiquitin-like protease family profile domain-containing protein n=1 Tax=Carnegiea gigantea TaxID=171969 RepID=A0A9Q1GVN2_9CARY|nr:hypothetical protein Cgig2_021397 [Carnegiea gigantea]